MENQMRILAFALFAATIPAANWMIGNVGECIPNGPCIIPVGFGLYAPSGVLMIGLALVLRDWLHELGGWRFAGSAIIVGAALSLITSPAALALASAVAFTVAEGADLLVYSKLREKGKPLAVMASQVVGALIDSMLFVFIAFGSLDFSTGNALAKIYAGVFVAAALIAWGRRRA